MFSKYRDKINRWRFFQASRAVLDTPPIQRTEDPVRILSSVSHMDLYMYLVALKTYFRYAPFGKVTILDDGSLTPDDLAILDEHANPVDVIPLDDVAYRGGEKGVRWGILLTMAELAEDNFVVQLDSDTVTVGEMPHVTDAISQNRSFTLGTTMGTEIRPASETVTEMRKHDSQHVQVVAEQNLDKLRGYPDLKYVRGNSGLVGLGKGALTRQGAEDFLEDMTRAIGAKWRERGSFQMASNFVVSNAPDAFVLPLAEYRYYHPDADLDSARFIHYMGTYRFVDRSYFDTAHSAVADLLSSAQVRQAL